MNYLLLPDKFKGSLSAEEVATSIRSGISKCDPDAQFTLIAASDGGDGFLAALEGEFGLERKTVKVAGPLFETVEAEFLVHADKNEAYIEMAMASGLVLLDPKERNPLKTTTLGTGELILEAVGMGAREIYVGLGGSATNDGGLGVAVALGYIFKDKAGNILPPVGESLEKIHRIIPPKESDRLQGVTIYAVNDVTNPLFGPQGAAHIYAPQKGATPEIVEMLDSGLRNLDKKVLEFLNLDLGRKPGAGAAGGTSYGLMAFLNARMINGTEFILRRSGIFEMMQNSPFDYLITGEGRLDAQTMQGKWISGVIELGKTFDVPVIAVCGLNELEGKDQVGGLEAILEVKRPEYSLEQNMERAAVLVEARVEDYFKKVIRRE